MFRSRKAANDLSWRVEKGQPGWAEEEGQGCSAPWKAT